VEKMAGLNSFEFVLPTRIIYGEGVIRQVGDIIKEMNGSSIMVVTDKGLIKAGLAGKVIQEIKDSGLKNVELFDEVEPNPRDTTVARGYEIARNKNINVLVAIGGGSSMDTAKAIGVLLSHGGTIRDYEGVGKLQRRITPLICIPTTVGTGSEVTFWSVITDTKRHFKMSVGGPLIAPKVALVDPDMVASLPSAIIASTGMDALTHAIEGYTATVAEPITDACGLYAIRLIAENIRDAVYTDSKDAKANMLIGSLIAGICFGNSDIAGVHCVAEALGGLYDTPHGIANAIMLPYLMEYNYVANIEKYAEIAVAMGENVRNLSLRDAAYQSVVAVKKLNDDLNIQNLKAIGVQEKDLPELAKRSSINVSVDSNPRKAGEKEFLDIFKKAFND
jgi:alcohol dehydrogenase